MSVVATDAATAAARIAAMAHGGSGAGGWFIGVAPSAVSGRSGKGWVPRSCVICRRSVMPGTGDGQPLVERDGLISVGVPRGAELDGEIDVGRTGGA